LVLPRALGRRSLRETTLIASFPELAPRDAVALVRAARLYQDAIWIAESEPNLSWVMFVSAIETAAGHWRSAADPPVDRLKASKPDLARLLEEAGGEELALKVANQISDYMGATKKFVDFALEFMPEPPIQRPSESFQHPWEQRVMKESLRKIYDWRSRALHSGTPFPFPMCEPPYRDGNEFAEKPMGLATMAGSAVWVIKDTPMLLHTFEYIVRHVLLKWWEAMLPNAKRA